MGSAAVWLDDLDRFLTVEGLRTDWIDLLTAGGAITVATLRGGERDQFTSTGDVRHPQSAALERFTQVRVRDDDDDENARLAVALPEAEQQTAVRRSGLGAFLGGGPIAETRFENNRDRHPLGCALVRAAADWRRIGLTNITRTELAGLAPTYLPENRRYDHGETTDGALAWATERTNQVVQLLEVTSQDTVTCTDYILDYITRDAAPIPHSVWEAAIATAQVVPGDLFTVAVNAYEAGFPIAAAVAFRRITSTSHDLAPRAAFNLGVLEEQEGNLDAARAAYQLAIGSGSDQAPAAAFNLGVLEKQEGNLDAARAAYQLAIGSGHPEQAAAAATAIRGFDQSSL